MSTAAQVRSAWQTAVFDNSTIQAITPNNFSFEVTEDSEAETQRLYYNKELNFIQFVIKRAATFKPLNEILYTFTVDVTYTRAYDVNGENYSAAVDFFDTLFARVDSGLGTSWSSTVDYWVPQESPPEIQRIDFESSPAWRGTYRFIGYQSVSH